MRKSFKTLLFLGALLLLALPVMAQSGTWLRIYDVSDISCTPGDRVTYNFRYVVAAGDASTHHWTLSNPRAGTSNIQAVGPFYGPSDESFTSDGAGIVPAGTQPGDILVQTVVATSNIGHGSTTSIAFNCSTGEVISGSSGDNDDPTAGPPFVPGDDRVNQRDAWASYAVYCRDGGISVWAIVKDGLAFESFVATAEEIEAVGENPDPAAIIDSGPGGDGGEIVLYRRPDGLFQINGPAQPPDMFKGYVVEFGECVPGRASTFHEYDSYEAYAG